jgi:4-hydroxythreonine-4-phosphate dehydrogenase
MAITMGDPAGIGPEVCVRALEQTSQRRASRLIVVGDSAVIQATVDGLGASLAVNAIASVVDAEFRPGLIEVLDLNNVNLEQLKKGEATALSGAAAFDYVVLAIDLAMQGTVDALVTSPIHKKALHLAGHRYPGHTEILAERTDTREYAMMLVAEKLRVVLATTHVALREEIGQLNEERILRAITFAHEAGSLLGIEAPSIVVPGLNPHAGEGGLFGREEIEVIAPAVKRARSLGFDVHGPLPADTAFYRARQGEFDFVVPLFHDQGLIPIKLIGFGRGVNVTLGLPIIRTSVDHGTAFDIAWEFRADAGSLVQAIKLAEQTVMAGG